MTKYQDCVPYHTKSKSCGMQIKSAVLAIIFFLSIVLVFILLVAVRREEKCFDKQTFYYVSVLKSRAKIDKTKQDTIKKLGGAGSVVFYKEYFNLVANVYLSESSAKDVIDQVKNNFESAEIVKIEAKVISKSKQKTIRENLSFYRFFKYLNDLVKDYESISCDYMLGEVTEGKTMSKLISKKLELEEIIHGFENKNGEKLFDDIKTYANMLILHFDSFFDEFYQSTKKQSLICLLGVNISIVKFDLFDNL